MTVKLIWLALILVFGVIEAATVALTSMWFAAGAFAALISSLFGAPLWLQIAWFILVSGLTLIFGRPFIQKRVMPKPHATNYDRVLDMEGVVTESIDNLAGTGAVRIDGKEWTARTEENSLTVPKGAVVSPVRIDGVKLIVRAVSEKSPNGSISGADAGIK